jgi:Spy/CpxP family protein refolding chaperone
MIRRIVPVIAIAALLGACSSNSNNMPEPGSPNTSRTDDQGGPGRGGRGGNGGGPGGGARMEEMLLRGITLSSDQQQRIESIRASYRSQMEQSRQSGNTDRAAMRTMMEKQQADIRGVLTADQQAQFDRNISEMRARQQQNGGRRPGSNG